MKLFKKPLAVFIAMMIVICSISGAVYAALINPSDGELKSETTYYVKNGSGWDLVTNGKVSPGDEIKAAISLTTDFYAGTYNLFYLYDKDVFSVDDTNQAALEYNSSLLGSATEAKYTATATPANTYALGEDIYDTYGELLARVTPEYVIKYNGDEVFYFYLTVKSDALVDAEGEVYLPTGAAKVKGNNSTMGYLTEIDQLVEDTLIEKLDNGQKVTITDANEVDEFAFETSYWYDLTIVDPQNYVTLDGTVKFDAGEGVIEEDGNVFEAYGYYDTAIGSHTGADPLDDDRIPGDPVWSGYKFDGWSTKKAAGEQNVGGTEYFYGDQSAIISDEDIAALKYKDGDDVVTLYAVYEKADTTYSVNVWEPAIDEDGNLVEEDGQVQYVLNEEKSLKDIPGKAGDVIDAEDVTAPEGFTNNSKDTMTLTEDGPNTLDVKLDRNKNDVKWVIDGEEDPVKTEQAYYGANLGKLEDPIIDNEDPADKYFGQDVSWSEHDIPMGNEPVTVTGTLTPKDVAVTYNYDGATEDGTPVSGHWKNADGKAVTPYGSEPEYDKEFSSPDGYSVKGWKYTDATGASKTVDSISDLPALTKDNYTFGTDPAGNLTIDVTPVFETNKGQVTFDANGGKWSDNDTTKTIDQTYNEKTVLPGTNPSYPEDGFEFLGWATSKGATEALEELPKYTEDTTYFAVWKDNNATVQWLAPNGEVVKEVKGALVENISSKNPSKEDVLAKLSEDDQKKYAEGYDWTWDTVPGDKAAVDTKINGKFEPVDCSIVYLDEDGNIIKTISGKYDSAITETAPDDLPDTTDKKFVGWSMALPATMPLGKDTVGDLKNVTKITPVFDDVDKVTITFEHEDGTTEEVSGYPGQPVTAPELKDSDKKDGFDSKWDSVPETFPATDPETPVKVEFTAKPVEVSFNSNGGTPAPEDQKPGFDETLEEPADPERSGSDFLGWYLPDGTKFDFSKPINEQLDSYSDNLELKAKYGIKDVYHIATGFDPETGEFIYDGVNQFDKTDDEIDKTYTVPEIPDMEGFDTIGWNDAENGKGNAVTPDGNFGTESREFWPDYEIKTFKVIYLNEDGSEYANYDVTFGGKLEKPTDPTKPADENGEFIFSGWTDEDGKSPDNYATMPAKDLTFRPGFIQKGNEFTATYVVDDETYRTYTIREGDPMIVPEDPEKFGYVFAGWTPEVPATMPGEDVVYTAQWEIDKTFVAVVIGGTVVSGGVIAGVAAANAALITGAAVIGGAALIGGGIAIANHIKDKNNNSDSDVDTDIPATGSKTAGLAAFAVISSAAAAAYVMTKKKED